MVRAQGTGHRAQGTEHGAQGTIEYLIIIAIVIVIALVVVSLLTGMLSPAQGVGQSINKVGNWSNTVALTESSVTPDGNYLVRLANMSGEEFTVSNVAIGDTDVNYSEDLFQGNAQNFVIDSDDVCSTGDNVSKDVIVTYVSKNGITKREIYPAKVFFSCENYTVNLLASRCEVCTTYTTQYLSPSSYTLTSGLYDLNDLRTIDTDLVAAKIISGTTIFGVAGSYSGVDTSDANAQDANIQSGATCYGSIGNKLTGTLATQYLSPTSTTLTAGYYDTNNLVTITDNNLAAGNILTTATIFGITGTASAGGGDPGYYQLGTGQTICYDTSGTPRSCSGTGEDGDIYGSSYAHVWVDNSGDGTVSDTTSGLMWQKADNGSTITWQDALTYCNNLSLAGHSDWHLPNFGEIGQMFDYENGICQSVFTGCNYYWSSTSMPAYPYDAYYLDTYNGLISSAYEGNDFYYRARCVRFEN